MVLLANSSTAIRVLLSPHGMATWHAWRGLFFLTCFFPFFFLIFLFAVLFPSMYAYKLYIRVYTYTNFCICTYINFVYVFFDFSLSLFFYMYVYKVCIRVGFFIFFRFWNIYLHIQSLYIRIQTLFIYTYKIFHTRIFFFIHQTCICIKIYIHICIHTHKLCTV